jgi:hypothetical protein
VSEAGGLGVCLVDPAMHDERELQTLSRFCDGRVDVREGDDGPELRAQEFSASRRRGRRSIRRSATPTTDRRAKISDLIIQPR